MHTKKIVLISGLVALLALMYWFVTISEPVVFSEYTTEPVTFVSGEQELGIRYDVTGTKAQVSFDGLQYDLEQVASVSGVRFVNPDESVVFFEDQEEARLEINGQTVIEGAQHQDTNQ